MLVLFENIKKTNKKQQFKTVQLLLKLLKVKLLIYLKADKFCSKGIFTISLKEYF